jgi:hypothetical protein
MTVSRLISPGLRSGLIVVVGLALLFAPVTLALGVAGSITSIAIGVATVALGLAGSDETGRGVLPISAQAAYDLGLAAGLLAASVLFGIVGDGAALGLFLVTGLVVFTIAVTTRYTLARPH